MSTKKSDKFPISGSLLFVVMTEEHHEIDRLKWIESEKAGKDIGFLKAYYLWSKLHKDKWLREFTRDKK